MDAIDDLSDALETTRNLLTPVRLGIWVKLAIVVFFVSSLGMGGPTVPGGDITTFADEPGIDGTEEFESEFGEEFPVEEFILGLLVIGAIALVLWLLYSVISAVMEFVFIESLRSSEVHIRRYFSANIGNGLRLLVFQLGVILVTGALASAPAALVFVLGDFGDLSVGLIGLYALYGLGLFLIYSVIQRFTSVFVVPVMLQEDRGVLSAWSRFWSTFTANWTEYVVYLVLVWILSIAIAIAAWFVIAFGVLALLIPFVIVIVLLVFLGEIGVLLAIPVGLLAVVCILLFISLVWTPIETYFQYYALLLLGDTNADLDLIPEQRAAVRSDGGALTDRDDDWNGDDGDGRENRDQSRNDGWSTDDSASRNDDPDDEYDPWDTDSSSWDDDTDRDDNRGW
ncbi:hypothetical protein DV706_15870 (plasmid) [Natronorubrum bangense]|uniref:Glycerophosphoryl diester phosphodiesterase membrane domain-containing protein n=1 Tax=Natronorubrum bangense TaxID=61858 RepID=A0A4D6HKH3_9EURY|nr:hypothetical protein [Natronorubrum bangense]QCC53257.1 hypothetical protein DV706_01400 [Natronorubrum bangense]QCC56050.1 hypothetical protein DV706_15870 [Natronorubrum bangense]